ncbi:MAG: hypothetical protein ACJASX_001770 [Limisphaerales bacterium]
MVIGLCWSLYHEFTENDPIDFFRAHPSQLFVVAIVAVLIGLAVPAVARVRRHILFRLALITFVIASAYVSWSAIQIWSFHFEWMVPVDSPLYVELPIEFTLGAVFTTVFAIVLWGVTFCFLRGSRWLPSGAKSVEGTCTPSLNP